MVYLVKVFLVTFDKILKKCLLSLFLFNLYNIIITFYFMNRNFCRIQRWGRILLMIAYFTLRLLRFLSLNEMLLGYNMLIIFYFRLKRRNLILYSYLLGLKRFLSRLFWKSQTLQRCVTFIFKVFCRRNAYFLRCSSSEWNLVRLIILWLLGIRMVTMLSLRSECSDLVIIFSCVHIKFFLVRIPSILLLFFKCVLYILILILDQFLLLFHVYFVFN